MSTQQNTALVQNYLETAWRKHDAAGLAHYIAANHINHGPFTDQMPPGLQGFQAFTSTFLTAFPDVQYTIDRQEADGDLVRTWVTFVATQTGQLMDVPPTGKRVTVPVFVTDRIAGGKVAETWSEWDAQDMLRQLGVG